MLVEAKKIIRGTILPDGRVVKGRARSEGIVKFLLAGGGHAAYDENELVEIDHVAPLWDGVTIERQPRYFWRVFGGCNFGRVGPEETGKPVFCTDSEDAILRILEWDENMARSYDVEFPRLAIIEASEYRLPAYEELSSYDAETDRDQYVALIWRVVEWVDVR